VAAQGFGAVRPQEHGEVGRERERSDVDGKLIVGELHGNRPWTLAVSNRSPDNLNAFMHRYGFRDPRLRSMLGRLGRVWRDDEVEPADFDRSSIVHEFLDPFDVRRQLGSILVRDGNMVGLMGVLRPRGAGRFSDEAVRRFELLVPHFQRSFALHQRLGQAAALAESLRTFLDTVESPVLLLDRFCRVVFTNGAAETLLTGRALAVRNGRLVCTRPAENDALARAVANAAEAACGRETLGRQHVVNVRQADAAEPLRFLVCPLARSHPLSDIGSVRAETAVIGVHAAGASPGTAAVLAAAFGLTAAETRLAAQLASGASLAEAAEQLRVSRTTVRTQLQSVFAKTETRRQADLMRVLQGCLLLPLRTDRASLPAGAARARSLGAASVAVARTG
jgi:DNA-binding CsgD family transcriptional regulator